MYGKLDLLLSKWYPDKQLEAKQGFAKQVHLCRFAFEDAKPEEKYWRKFDLVDALLFPGEHDNVLKACEEAIAFVPKDERKDVLTSVLGPLQNILIVGVIDQPTTMILSQVVEKLRAQLVNAQ